MAASINDLFTRTRNGARPSATTVTSTRAIAGTTLACGSLAGWPTASAVHFVTYKIDTSNEVIAGTQCDWKGIVSGTNITNLTLKDGTDAGNAIGDVVEMLPTAAWGEDLAEGLEVEHNRNGTHSAVTATSLTTTGSVQANTSLISDVIAEKTSANGVTIDSLNIKDGKLNTNNSVVYSNLLTTLFSGQITTGSIAGTIGGTYNLLNLGGVKILWGISATQSIGAAGNPTLVLAFPASTFSTTPTFYMVSPLALSSVPNQQVWASTLTSSQMSVSFYNPGGGTATISVSWLVIGT